MRYTQDSWTNDSPNVNTNLWGDDPFPAVDSDWDQPGKSFMAQLNHNVGIERHEQPDLLLLRQQDHHRPRADEPRAERARSSPPSRRLPAQRQAVRRRDAAIPSSGAAAGYPTLWNEAPFRNNQDLFILKDDYSAGLRQTLREGRHPRQHQRQERGLERQRLGPELGVLGLGRRQRLGRAPPATSWPTSCSRT